MDYILEKSKFNIEAAEHLIQKKCFASSVHCSYYGSFQFMKYKLKIARNETYDKIDLDCKNHPKGTHVYIITRMLNVLEKKTTFREFVKTKRAIKDLKEFRINSDYYDIQIMIDDAEKSLKYSQEIIHTFTENLK